MSVVACALGAALVVGGAWPRAVGAQRANAWRAGVVREAEEPVGRSAGGAWPRAATAAEGDTRQGALGDWRLHLSESERRRWAPVASLFVPGSGQALLRQDRFVAYLALEAWAVLEVANQRTEARRQQNRYRALARNVARALYGPSYPVGSWAYYESMEHYLESGVFDRLPGGDVDPDINTDTYNGAMWLLARTTYWADPNVTPPLESAEYRRAFNMYLDRAVRPEYRWSWRNAQLEQDIFIRTIRRSNTSFREARAALGIVLANHLLSAVDAFVTLRVEGLDGGRGVSLRGAVALP